jgi:hypothetical protein
VDYIRGEKIVLPQFTVAEITNNLWFPNLKKRRVRVRVRVMPIVTESL